MIFESSEFVFEAPSVISRARRVLIKPNASVGSPYPVSTSREMLSSIISGIRQVSDADILILESTPTGEPIYPVYQALNYNFPRVLMLDVRNCIWVEVDNPLSKPYVVPTFWVPNVILSSDYLISVTPLKVFEDGNASLSIPNLLTLLPPDKYKNNQSRAWAELYALGIEKVLADLYFTLPFDLGIIEAKSKLVVSSDATRSRVEDCGLVFVGEPAQVDAEAADVLKLNLGYMNLIKEARVAFEM